MMDNYQISIQKVR